MYMRLRVPGHPCGLFPNRVPVHAFVDESSALTELRKPGQRRLHLNKEQDPRRRLILDRIAALPVRAHVYAQSGPAPQARRTCLTDMTADLLKVGARRLVIELRRQQRVGDLDFEHLAAKFEPILWAADAVAWGYGADGDWARRIQPLVDIRP